MDDLTAAHRTLPFGTLIDVHNLDNDRHVELRVTDRGPFVDNRILDLSRAGARAIDMIGPGTANIRITILRPGGDAVAVRGGCVVVQIAAYRDGEDARRKARDAAALGFRSEVEEADGWHRVVVGPFTSAADTQDAVETLDGFARRCSD